MKKNLPGKIILILLLLALAAVMLLRVGAAKKESAEPAATPAPAAEPLAAAETVSVTPEPKAEATPTPEATAEPTPEPEEEFFEISFIGDCTLSASKDKLDWGIGYQLTVGSDYGYPFRNTAEYLKDDYLTVGNLECNLSDNWRNLFSPTYEQFVFCSEAGYANILSEGGVDFVTLANNHTKDLGETAYADTEKALDAAGVAYAGEDQTYIFQTGDGLKVGLYCLYNQLTGNALSILSAQAQENLISASRGKIEAGLQSLREQGAEYAIAVLHMGTEGYYEPTDVQYDLCRHSIDSGFNAVYCTHAHRLQPAELYEDGIIFYGMGNWSFGGHTNPGNGTDPGAFDTGIAKISVRRCGSEVSLDGFSFIPCSISSSVDPETGALNANSVNNYQPTPYVKDSPAYNRAMSMLSGTYEGANYAVGNYWDLLARMG